MAGERGFSAMNSATHQEVYGKAPASPTTIISEIPIAPDNNDPAYTATMNVLKRAGLTDTQISSAFDPGSSAQSVEISSFLSGSVDPIVIDSLTRPILEHRAGTTLHAPQTRHVLGLTAGDVDVPVGEQAAQHVGLDVLALRAPRAT